MKKKHTHSRWVTHHPQGTKYTASILLFATGHRTSHFTRAPYLQVYSLHPARVIQGSRRAFGQGGGENGLFFFIPGKRSVAEPDKPRTESVT